MTCENRDIILQNAVDPYHIRFDITNEDQDGSDIDFTDIITAEFSAQKPDGTEVTWPAQIESVSSTAIRLAYAFQTGDLDQLGEYQVVPQLNTALGGVLFARARRFTVKPEFKE